MVPPPNRPLRLKRCFDVVASTVLLVLLAPLIGAVAVAVRLRLGTPVIFRQVRPGLDGRPFVLYKFRTMRDDRDRHGNLLDDGERLTPFGRLLRSLSLDELPELANVLRGDMSLVGPRPLMMEYLERYDERQRRRHEVPPGITGWAQIHGRNAVTWEERFEHDLYYVEHGTFALDLKILWQTVATVLRRDGISAEGHATMPEFWGTQGPPRGVPSGSRGSLE